VPYIKNDQTNSSVLAPDAAQKTHGLRVDFNYQLGDHNLGVGVDNMHYEATNQGVSTSGPGYLWTYLKNYKHADVTYPYAVRRRDLTFRTNMSMDQKAYYLQDIWQVMPNLQLNLGLRNDHFTNYTDTGAAFVDEKNQWEPRLGFSWDVNGDSSFKVYGNAGRYYLALPDNAAERAANSSTYLFTYYTYTGIDENGIPTGLGLINGPISPDGETGAPKDPKQVTSANLKPEYLDEYILGVDKTLGDKWVYGAKMMYRDLKTAIDDECSPGQIATKMTSMGLNPDDYYDSLYGANYCRLINPGLTNDIRVQKNDGTYTIVSMSQSDWGYLEKAKRTTASLSLYMEHPFDGTWSGRVDYTYSYGRGNTEGQVRSDFGQGDVSKTEDWDSWQLMQGQDGELINNRRHSLRLYGAWQISPQFLASANVLIQSGTPKECLGYFGPDAHGDPTGYNAGGGGNYHWCAGQIVHPGDPGHTPWTKQVNLGLRYTPNFGHGKLAFALDVFNALDEQKLVQADPIFAAGDHVVSNTYGDGLFYEAPRFVRLSVSYDY
jgi:outer membrane receptor protein involved in Fe transport